MYIMVYDSVCMYTYIYIYIYIVSNEKLACSAWINQLACVPLLTDIIFRQLAFATVELSLQHANFSFETIYTTDFSFGRDYTYN